MKRENARYGGILSSVTSGIADLARRSEPIGHLWEGDRLDGRSCLVTGASSGLGFAAACELRRRGARVIVASRSADAELEERIRGAAGRGGDGAAGSGAGAGDGGRGGRRRGGSGEAEPAVVAERLDLSRFDSVVDFVDRLVRRGELLDVVVSNAGVVTAGSRETADGYDEMLQVNYLATYLLIRKLVDSGCVASGGDGAAAGAGERGSAPAPATGGAGGRRPRIVLVSSEVHRSAPDIDLDDPFTLPRYSMSEALRYYGYSKLLLTTFSEELSRRLNGDDADAGGTSSAGDEPGVALSVFTMCPGAMNTNIAREAPALFRPFLGPALALFFRSPEKAAEPVIYLATSPDLEGSTGVYLHLMTAKDKDPRARDPERGRRVWESSERALRHYFEGSSPS